VEEEDTTVIMFTIVITAAKVFGWNYGYLCTGNYYAASNFIKVEIN